jgi:hypothetical protein
MSKKTIVALCAIPLMAMPPLAFSAGPASIEKAVSLIKSGDIEFVASIVLSTLPQSVLQAVPESFVTYNAMRLQSARGGNGEGWGQGRGGGRGPKC